MLYEVAIVSFGGDETTLANSFIISLEINNIMGTVKRKVPSQFPRFSIRYQHKRRFFLLLAVQKGDTTRFFPQIPLVKSASPGGLR
jgi:hypothetical protein